MEVKSELKSCMTGTSFARASNFMSLTLPGVDFRKRKLENNSQPPAGTLLEIGDKNHQLLFRVRNRKQVNVRIQKD